MKLHKASEILFLSYSLEDNSTMEKYIEKNKMTLEITDIALASNERIKISYYIYVDGRCSAGCIRRSNLNPCMISRFVQLAKYHARNRRINEIT